MSDKRDCIFTGKEADTKLVISGSKHNWAKSVPCCKKYIQQRGEKSLSPIEFQLVELFYQKELLQSQSQQTQLKMQELREELNIVQDIKYSFDTIRCEIHPVEVPESVKEYQKGKTEELTEEEKPVKIVKKKDTGLWS